jgi:hypothetical protein
MMSKFAQNNARNPGNKAVPLCFRTGSIERGAEHAELRPPNPILSVATATTQKSKPDRAKSLCRKPPEADANSF